MLLGRFTKSTPQLFVVKIGGSDTPRISPHTPNNLAALCQPPKDDDVTPTASWTPQSSLTGAPLRPVVALRLREGLSGAAVAEVRP